MRPPNFHSLARIALTAALSASLTLPALARGDGPGGNGVGSPGVGTGGTGPSNRRGDNGAETSIANVSRTAGQAIDACDIQKTPTECIADVLDKFAIELAEVAPQLPPELRDLPEVIATAAHKVRAAKSKTEALRAIGEAIVVVHKSIALLKADDPIAHQAATREGGFVVATLQIADAKLQKAVGL